MINIKKVQGLEWKKTHQPIVKDSKRQMFGYGMELVVNLYDCDLKKISSKSAIQKFVITLCDKVIHMKR
ncbi:MAG: hypothetical protein UV04_C0020G0021, partial [Candidatus Gottesmanbacteria bacterium GW2011_GWA2_42_16]